MASSSAACGLPNSKEAWEIKRKEYPEDDEKPDKSASKIEIEQFLGLKVLWNINALGITQEHINATSARMKELEPWTEYLKFVGKKETKCDCSEVPKCSGCCNKGLPPLKYYGIQEWIWCPHCRKELGNRKSNKEICNTWQKHSIKLGTFALVLENQREVQGIVTVAEPEAQERDIPRYPRRNRTKVVSYQQHCSPRTPTPAPRGSRDGDRARDPSTPDKFLTQAMENLVLSPKTPLNEASFLDASMIPEDPDEQIVNTALINFLASITQYFPCPARWTLKRKAFRVDKWEARTDGYLTDGSQVIKAIIEVKAAKRHDKKPVSRVRMQEGAQMAAWILTHPDTGFLSRKDNGDRKVRVLISQDRHEIFVTFAEYGPAYTNDKWQGKGPIDYFLTMNEYGPFDIRHSSHMQYLGAFILIFAERMCGAE